MFGCANPKPVAPERMESAEAVIAAYNANAARLGRVWGTVNTFARFRDPDSGQMRREVGDGHFIYMGPNRVALTTGKLGNVLLWAGSNEQRFWFFDLQDEGVAYVGSYARLGEPGAQPLPLPVRPDHLPGLIGLTPIDPTEAHAEWRGGDLLVEPGDGARRLLLDARTGLAKRVDLLDAEGDSVIVCKLSGVKAVDHEPELPQPGRLPAEAHIEVVSEEGDLTLKLANLTDKADKFNPRAFNFEALVEAYEPGRVVDLDGQ